MPNTINPGALGNVPYYQSAGTDLSPMPFVGYDNSPKIFTFPGFAIGKGVYTGGFGFSGMSFQNFFAGQPVNTFNFVRGRGNFSAKTVPLAGDEMANITVAGWGGTTPNPGASIKAVLVGTASSTSMPTEWVFGTHNGTALADRAKITKDGQLNINSISNFSGSDLTLSPTGQVVLGTPAKVKITGGTGGQVLSTDGNGNLSWETVSGGGGGTQTASIVTTVGDITPDFDLNGDGDVSSADAASYIRMGGEGEPTELNNLNNRSWIRGSWANTAAAYGGLFTVEGNSLDALRAAVGAAPLGFGDSILLGNVTKSTGYFKSGVFINGGAVTIRAQDLNNMSVPKELRITSSTDGSGSIDISGNLRVTGEITSYFSDERLKKDIVPIQNALSKVLAICGYTYTSNNKADELGVGKVDNQIGLLAQEVEAVMPELVTNSAIEGYKTVRYDKLVSVLVNAVKEQQQMIDELRTMMQAKLA